MTEQALAGLNIIITRPREQAANLATQIAQQGGIPHLLPLLEISPPLDQQALRDRLARATPPDLIIFISPNAVSYGLAVLPTIPATTRIACVGQASAQHLREAGYAQVMAPEGRADSEALLALSALQDVAGQRVWIMRGEAGRELLGDTLQQRGAELEYIACYRRSTPELDVEALLHLEPDVLIVTSSEAQEYLWQRVQAGGAERLHAVTLFVPHERIAALAKRQGWQQVYVAPGGDDGMLEALVAWAHSQGK